MKRSGVIVIGRPIALSGNKTASTADADELFSQVRAHVTVPVVQWDERLTTRDAQKSLSEAGLTPEGVARTHRQRGRRHHAAKLSRWAQC